MASAMSLSLNLRGGTASLLYICASVHLYESSAAAQDANVWSALDVTAEEKAVSEDLFTRLEEALGSDIDFDFFLTPLTHNVEQGLQTGLYQIALFYPVSSTLPLLDVAAVPGLLDGLPAYQAALAGDLSERIQAALAPRGILFLAAGAFSGSMVVVRSPLDTPAPSALGRIAVSAPLDKALFDNLDGPSGIVQPGIGQQLNDLAVGAIEGVKAPLFRLMASAELSGSAFTEWYAYEWPFGQLVPWVVAAELRWFEGLAEDQQQILREVAEAFQAEWFQRASELEIQQLEELEEYGMSITGFHVDALSPLWMSDSTFDQAWEAWAEQNQRRGYGDETEDIIRSMREVGIQQSQGDCGDTKQKCGDRRCRRTCN